jgi:hypothetical protein
MYEFIKYALTTVTVLLLATFSVCLVAGGNDAASYTPYVATLSFYATLAFGTTSVVVWIGNPHTPRTIKEQE